MQQAVERDNRAGGEPLAMRIGISAGDATYEDGDWFGRPVIEASRLCAEAEGGQILVAGIVKVLAGSRAGHELVSVGELALKGLPEPVDAAEVRWEPESGGADAAGELTVALPVQLERVDAFSFVGREATSTWPAWPATSAGTTRPRPTAPPLSTSASEPAPRRSSPTPRTHGPRSSSTGAATPTGRRASASEALATAEDLGVARLAETATRHLTALA